MPHLDETDEEDKQETTGHTESVEKKEFGKTEDADIGLKEQYKRAAPPIVTPPILVPK